MTPQDAAMLQNNAGNPAMVSRIAQERGLSQEEIAEALKIPAEAASRYMGQAAGGMAGGEDATRSVRPEAGMAGGAGGGRGDAMGAQVVMPGAIGGDSLNPIYEGTPEGDAFRRRSGMGGGPMNDQRIGGDMPTPTGPRQIMNQGMGGSRVNELPQVPTIADQGMKPAAPPPPTQGPQTKPMPMPAPGKPMPAQMGKPMMDATAPAAAPAAGGRPALGANLSQPMGRGRGRPNLAGAQRPQSNAGEQAFVSAFNRMRGNVQ